MMKSSEHNKDQKFRYQECMKNHAAALGVHASDGCGEFMPSGSGNDDMICAACQCHRNFHRKEVLEEMLLSPGMLQLQSSTPQPIPLSLMYNDIGDDKNTLGGALFRPLAGAVPLPSQPSPISQRGGLFGAFIDTKNKEELQEGESGTKGKRRRTKFTQEQKEKMVEFAEMTGWKIQKSKEAEMEQFCNQVGIERRAMKVWMHNNKHVMKKRENAIEALAREAGAEGMPLSSRSTSVSGSVSPPSAMGIGF